MKKILFFIVSLLLCLTASAQYTRSICFRATNGTEMVFNLSTALEITFDDNNLVARDGTQKFTISLDEVTIEYLTTTNSISDAEIDRKPVIGEGTITFSDVKAGEPVQVFSIDGKLLLTMQANDAAGRVVVDLTALPKGVIVIKQGKFAVKYHNGKVGCR